VGDAREALSEAARQRQSHDDGAVPAAEVALLADPDIDRAQVNSRARRGAMSGFGPSQTWHQLAALVRC
jgi:hypothetical protein